MAHAALRACARCEAGVRGGVAGRPWRIPVRACVRCERSADGGWWRVIILRIVTDSVRRIVEGTPAWARLERARSLWEEDRDAEALQSFAALAVEFPEDPDPAECAGYLAHRFGDFERAVCWLGVARPRLDGFGWGLLFVSLWKLERYEEAFTELR